MEKKAPGPPGIIVTALVLLPLGWLIYGSAAITPMIWYSKMNLGIASTEVEAGFWHQCTTAKIAGGLEQSECKKLENTGCDEYDEHLDGGKASVIITIVLSAVYLAFIIVDICCRNVLVSWLGGLIGLMAFIFSCISWIIAASIWNEGFCNRPAFKDQPGAELYWGFYDMFFGSMFMGAAILMHWINRSFCEHDQCCNECCPCTCCCPHCFTPDEVPGEAENEPTKAEA